MKSVQEIYCGHCQVNVRPIKAIVLYRCPKCGATFTPSAVETQADELPPAAEPPAIDPQPPG